MIGIDNKIERVRILFEQALFLDYGYTAYGRAFLNQKEGNTIPEILDADNEYKEMLLDDKLDAQSFFVVENDYTVENSKKLSGEVSIYFAVNLGVVYPSVSERAVEYIHRDVMNILKGTDFQLTGITSGRDAFSGFEIKVGDNMQPFYLVKFTTAVSWLLNDCVRIPTDAITYENGNFIAMENGAILIGG